MPPVRVQLPTFSSVEAAIEYTRKQLAELSQGTHNAKKRKELRRQIESFEVKGLPTSEQQAQAPARPAHAVKRADQPPAKAETKTKRDQPLSKADSKRVLLAQKKVIRRAQPNSNNQCVWNALLSGVIGLAHGTDLRSHAALLCYVKRKCTHEAMATVKVNGEALTPQLCRELTTAVAGVHIGDGYDCSSCDPLLVATCCAFSVDIDHEYLGMGLEYTVESPVRIVSLRSSAGHMAHVGNQNT
jgi:hypothetical protein